MRTRMLIICVLALLMVPAQGARLEMPPAPPEIEQDYGFADLDEATLKQLLEQGSLMIVRARPDMTLINVSAGQLVNAPLEVVWGVITDFEHYDEIMPQTSAQKVLEREDNRVMVEQEIAVKIWRLPSVDITQQLVHVLTPNRKARFYHVSGTLEGTYGGWDLVPVGDQTLAFYTLYSNLTALGWGLGGIFRSQPDFMTGVNMTTAMMVTKSVKEVSESRAGK